MKGFFSLLLRKAQRRKYEQNFPHLTVIVNGLRHSSHEIIWKEWRLSRMLIADSINHKQKSLVKHLLRGKFWIKTHQPHSLSLAYSEHLLLALSQHKFALENVSNIPIFSSACTYNLNFVIRYKTTLIILMNNIFIRSFPPLPVSCI